MWGKMDESGENVCPPHASSPRQNFFHKHDFIIFYNFYPDGLQPLKQWCKVVLLFYQRTKNID